MLNALQNSLRFDCFSVFGTWWNMVFLKGSWNFVLITNGVGWEVFQRWIIGQQTDLSMLHFA